MLKHLIYRKNWAYQKFYLPFFSLSLFSSLHLQNTWMKWVHEWFVNALLSFQLWCNAKCLTDLLWNSKHLHNQYNHVLIRNICQVYTYAIVVTQQRITQNKGKCNYLHVFSFPLCSFLFWAAFPKTLTLCRA